MADTDVLKPLIEHAMGLEREDILAGGEALRTFYAADAAGKVFVFVVPTEDAEGDDKAVKYLRLAFGALGIRQYVMVSEVWISEYVIGGPAPLVRPVDDPNRREALVAMGFRRIRGESGDEFDVTSLAECTIERNPTRVGALTYSKAKPAGGIWMRLIAPIGMQPMPDDLKAAVLAGLDQNAIAGSFAGTGEIKDPPATSGGDAQ